METELGVTLETGRSYKGIQSWEQPRMDSSDPVSDLLSDPGRYMSVTVIRKHQTLVKRYGMYMCRINHGETCQNASVCEVWYIQKITRQ